AYDFDCDFLLGFIRRQENYARSAMIDHAFQLVAHVDRVRYRLDSPQLDKTVTAKLKVRWVTPSARNTFAHGIVRIVCRHINLLFCVRDSAILNRIDGTML